MRQLDRDALERAGWRTTLDFKENHRRSFDGALLEVESMWVAEAEHVDGRDVITVSARSERRAWAELLARARARDRGFARPAGRR